MPAVVIDKDNTTIVGGSGKKADIQGRIELIRNQIAATTSDYDREKLEERLAKLTSGVAVIRVGAATEVELKEKKARVDDAVHALRAAVEEGIVPGGGVALVRAMKAVERLEWAKTRRRARGSLHRRDGGAAAADRGQRRSRPGGRPQSSSEGKGDFGFNAATEEYEDLVKAGVIDPAKVVRSALENAASVASLLITTEAAVAEKPKKRRRCRRCRGGGNGRHGRYGWHGRNGRNGGYGRCRDDDFYGREYGRLYR